MRTATVYNFLLEANIMASIAILLMLLARRFLRKPLGNRALYLAWLLVAVRLLCPLALPNPAINAIRSPFAQDEAIRPIAGQVKVRVSDALLDLARTAPESESLDRLVDDSYNGMLSIRLIHLYAAGVLAVSGWFVLSNARFRQKMRALRVGPYGDREAYEALCQRMKVKPVPVYYADPIPSACLVGVVRPYILLPLTAKPQESELVLMHELCHLKAHDPWWGLVRLLCCALHWFNPLVWLAASLSRTDGELACDERVVRCLKTQKHRDYAATLVLAATRHDAPGLAVLATGMTMTGRKLKQRVSNIVSAPKARRGLAAAFLTVACVTLVGAFATAEYKTDLDGALSVPAAAQTAVRAVENETMALQYAQELWKGDSLKEDAGSAQWSVADDASGGYEVTASWPDGATNILRFDGDGRVRYVYNGRSGLNGPSYMAAEKNYDDTTVENMAMYLLAFVEAVDPGMGNNIEAMHYNGPSFIDGQYVVDFTGDNIADGRDVLFRLQTEPQLRVVFYDNDPAPNG